MSEYTLELGGPIYELESIGVQGPAGADGDGAGGGSSTYLGLSDTPASFTADRLVAVNGTGDSLIHPTAAQARALLALGTAALSAAGDFATAAQGVLAGTAVQPADLADVATSGDYADLLNVPATFAPTAHTHTASEISDASAIGQSVMTAADAAAIRTLLSVYTQAQTDTAISDAIADLIGAAPAALDTLAEIADAINDDASFAATINAALANRLRLDAAGGYTSPQQAQGRSNLGLGTAATSDTVDFAAASHALGSHSDVAGTPTADQALLWDAIGSVWRATSLNAGHIKSGTFANARISQSSVAQHQAALAIAATQLTGNMPDARIIASNVTQHQAVLALAGSQISGKQGPGAAFDGGGSAITSGVVVRAPVTEAGTVTACYADADQSGSIDIIVRHYAAADTSFSSPTTLGTLSISSAQKGSLTGLSQAVAIGDTIEFETSGTIANIERLAVRSRI